MEPLSLPLRERGLKSIQKGALTFWFYHVAPFAGAWIEMNLVILIKRSITSLPLRERGLKSYIRGPPSWPDSRSLCGSVD